MHCSGRWPTPTRSRSSEVLLIATTLAPVLCSFLFHNKTEEKETLIDRVLKKYYTRSLKWALNHRLLTLGVMGGLLAFTLALLPGLGAEFMPELEEGNLWIRGAVTADRPRSRRPRLGASVA